MNMKKSIAGVMAGAMAVSAVAVSASAFKGESDQAQIVQSYDLKSYGRHYSNIKVVVTETYTTNASAYKFTESDKLLANKTSDVAFSVGAWGADGKFTMQNAASWGDPIQGMKLESVHLTAKSVPQSIYLADGTLSTQTQINTVDKLYYSSDVLGKLTGDAEKFVDVDNLVNTGVHFSTTENDLILTVGTKASEAAGMPGALIVDSFEVYGKELKETRGTTYIYSYLKSAEKPATTETAATFKADPVTVQGIDNADLNKKLTDMGVKFNYSGVVSELSADQIKTLQANDKAVVDAPVMDIATGNVKVTVKTVDKAYVPKADKVPAVYEYKYLNAGKNWTKSTYTDDKGTEYAKVTDAYVHLHEDKTIPSSVLDSEAGAGGRYCYVVVTTDVTTKEEVPSVVAYGFDSYTVVYTYDVAFKNAYNKVVDEKGNLVPATGAWTVDNFRKATSGTTNLEKSATAVSVNAGSSTTTALVKPLKTSLYQPANVINAIQTTKSEWGDGDKYGYNYYTAPLAVINDIVANNEDVSFTFNTYTGWVATVDGYARTNGDVHVISSSPVVVAGEGTAAKLADSVKTKDGKQVNSVNYWHNEYFNQMLYGTGTYNEYAYHLYGANGTQGDKDYFGSYASLWNKSLVSGGLVINEKVTMQLNDTSVMDWGDASITFYWDSIKDSAVTNASQFINSMLLYTPIDWYWDSMDIAVGDAIVYEAAAGAGAEDDATEVEEAPVEEEVVEEEDFEEEPEEEDFEEEDFEEEDFGDEEDFEEDFEEEEEPEEEEVEVEEVVVVEDVASPKTGNSPIALAVIPVALAAAAVVAKKRN